MTGSRRLEPRVLRGHMAVDLRSFGFGQVYRLGPAEMDPLEAVHAAYAKLAELRGERMAEAKQRDIFGDRAPELFAGALDAWQAQKQWDTDGSRRWGTTYARLVRADLGSYNLQDFNQPEGNGRMSSWIGALGRRRLSGRTIRNYLTIAEQTLRFCLERGWIASVPVHPRLPPKAAPIYRWISEPMFRALRAEVFRGVTLGEMSRVLPRGTDADLRLYVMRRRVYLSWLFYTGGHHYEADHANADWLFLDGCAYNRHNHKSAKAIEVDQYEMPEPLHADLMELCELQGRPFFPEEQFTGGPWPECAKAMQKAARRLKFPHGANPSILRRSYAREMFLLGYTEKEVADRMGHVDTRMLHNIYVGVNPRGRVERSRWTISRAANPPATGGNGMGRVVAMRPGA